MPSLSISVFLRALLSRLFRIGILPRALKLLLRLSRSFFRWLSKRLSGWKGHGSGTSLPTQDNQIARSETSKIQEDLTPKMPQPSLAHEPRSYTIVPDGPTISLEGVSASILSFGDGNIRHIGSRTSLRSTDSDIALRSQPGSRASSVLNLGVPPPTIGPEDFDKINPNYSRHYVQSSSTGQYGSPSPAIEVTSPVENSDSPSGIDRQSLPGVLPSTSSQTHVQFEGSTSYLEPLAPVAEIPSCKPKHLIYQVTPVETKRYERRTKINKHNTHIEITPIQLEYSDPALPQGWTRYAHPEGARYFYHPEWKLYTDADIYDPRVLHHLDNDLEYLKRCLARLDPGLRFPRSGEFVINVYPQEEDLESEYYCVDHNTQLVFFLENFQANDSSLHALEEVPGTRSQEHLKYEMMAQYWYFVQLYPHSLAMTKGMLHELRGIIFHTIGDCMTSAHPTSPYTQDDLNNVLSVIGELEKNLGSPCAGSTSFFGRQMYAFYHARFLNVHGESYARIERNFSIYNDPLYKRTWLIKTLSIPLFSAPEVHLKALQDMWVDEIFYKAVWEESMAKMNDEWADFLVLATVVLNANVAFLAIQTVDGNDHPYRSPAQIASYVSEVTIVGSIIMGLLLIRQNRTKNQKSAHYMKTFLLKRNYPTLGLETLAILYSLPYALLMWGLVSFLFAFCFMCLDNSNRPTHIAVGLACCVMVALVVWCIYFFWETKQDTEDIERPLAYEAAQKDCASVFSSQQSGEPSIRDTNRIQRLVSLIFDRIRLPWESAEPSTSDVHGEV